MDSEHALLRLGLDGDDLFVLFQLAGFFGLAAELAFLFFFLGSVDSLPFKIKPIIDRRDG